MNHIKTLLAAITIATLVTARGGGGGTTGPFSNGQAASVVIGQTDFVSGSVNQGGAETDVTLNNPYGNPFVNAGALYLPDSFNNRTLVYNSIPTSNGASAAFAIGQPDPTSWAHGTSATSVYNPMQAVIANGKMIQADEANNRVIIYNTVPTSSPGTIDVVVGQANKTSAATTCNGSTLYWPGSVATAGGKLIVPDEDHHRVLIWNSIPTTDGAVADVVLGQADFTHCAKNAGSSAAAVNTMYYPYGIWSDGTRMAVADTYNHRVLIWNTIPTTSNQPADLVLGQADFTSSAANQGGTPTASSMYFPQSVFSNGSQFFVADTANHRVLVWNSFPKTNDQAADAVLGQPDFKTATAGTSASLMKYPTGAFLYGKQLIVNDSFNSRCLIFNGQ